MKYLPLMGGLVLLFLVPLSGNAQLHPPRSLVAHLQPNPDKGVVSAKAHIDYLVRREGNNAWFNVSWSQIEINAAAGYRYKGKVYGAEVPGLVELLRNGKNSYPRVKFNVYYNEILQDSRVVQISARNDLGAFSGDQFTLKTTEDKLKNPNWRLEAEALLGFSNVDWWYQAEALIETYVRENKEKADYKKLVSDADAALARRDYSDALLGYQKAARYKQADNYPATQAGKVKELMQQENITDQFNAAMKKAADAERAENWNAALGQYELAATLGIRDGQAKANADRMRNKLDDLKRKEEERITGKKNENDEAARLKKEQDDLQAKLEEKDEDLQKDLDKKVRDEAKKLPEAQQKELEKSWKQQQDEWQAAWDKKKQEEKTRKEREEAREKALDDRLLGRYTSNMQWNPSAYYRTLSEAEDHYKKGMAIDPEKALELKKEWWDLNYFMKEFRDELNEPRRKQAFERAEQLMWERAQYFQAAKYSYMEAIEFTDNGSVQHKYLLRQVERMDLLSKIQKTGNEMARLQEEERQENFKAAKVFAVINRQKDNKLRAEMAYSHLTRQYMYPTHNTTGGYEEGNSKTNQTGKTPLEKQWDYENRLNEADRNLTKDLLITGATSGLVTSVLLDQNKTAQAYGNGAMGVNLFAYSGGASFPVVDNTEPNPDYVMASGVSNLAVMPFTGGMDLWLRRSRVLDLGLTGDLTFGVLPMLGYQNLYFSYGGNFKLNVGYKVVKLALEADYHNRSGSYEQDRDVANQDNQFAQPTGLIYTGAFNYSVLKVGGGLHFQLSSSYDDSYLRLLMYAEKPSFYQNYKITKPVLSFGFQFVFAEGLTFAGAFSGNYPAAGEARYMMRNYSTASMWQFGFGKTWTVGKTR